MMQHFGKNWLQTKDEGNIIMIAFVVSAMIMTLGLGLTRLLGEELAYTSNLYLSEKAYYAAEAGMEKALWELWREPVLRTENAPLTTFGTVGGADHWDATSAVTIDNLNLASSITGEGVESFELKNSEAAYIPLYYSNETGNALEDTEVATSNLLVTASNSISIKSDNNEFQISAYCLGAGNNNTYVFNKNDLNGNTTHTLGGISDGSATQIDGQATYSAQLNFLTFLTSTSDIYSSGITNDIDGKSCILKIKNSGNDNTLITIAGTSKIAPYIAKITATGTAGNVEKVLTYELAKKKLPPLLDVLLFNNGS